MFLKSKKNILTISILLILFAVVFPKEAYANFEKLYVNGKLSSIFMIVDFDEIYIPEVDIHELTGRKDIIYDKQTLAVIIGDVPLNATVTFYDNTTCYPLCAISRELFLPIKWDHKSGRIDLSTTPMPPTENNGEISDRTKAELEANGKTELSGINNQQPPTKRRRKKRGLFINLVNEDIITDTQGHCRAIRVTTLVTNTYFRDVKKAEATCVFKYPDGRILFEDVITLENVKSNSRQRVIFYTENPTIMDVPKYSFSVKEKRDR